MPIPATQTIDPAVLAAMNATQGKKGDTASSLQNNFMTLLVAQLKNQDPMNPMDNSQMTSQLAQINTVSGIQDLNNTLAGIGGQIDAGQVLQASALIGKGVLVPGQRILVGSDGTTTPFGFEIGQAAGDVSVTIKNGGGQVVRSFDLGPQGSGSQSFVWDGKLQDGTTAPKGAYSVTIKANGDGKDIPVSTLNYALVTGVSKGPDGPLLDLGGTTNQVGMDQVHKIL